MRNVTLYHPFVSKFRHRMREGGGEDISVVIKEVGRYSTER